MELRAFLQLFINRKNLIIGIVDLSLVVGFLAYRLQHQWYRSEVLLSVTRQGAEATAEYQYDQFYRLQADERMADTVARYLETEIGRQTVARRALLTEEREFEFIESKVMVLRLSPSLLRVVYRAKTPNEANQLAVAFLEAGEQHIASLNEQAANRNWFTLISSETFFRDDRFTFPIALALSFAAGVFVAFWTVLGLWYWRGAETSR